MVTGTASTAPGAASALPEPVAARLRDGSTAVLRPARRGDVERLQALFNRASRESLWLRFFTPRTTVDSRLLELMADVDGDERMTYLVTRGEGEAELVIGVASYVRLPKGDAAEIAFMVDDACQGLGIGTLLLERLADYATRHGIVRLVADVMFENYKMLDVFRNSGFKLSYSHEHGIVHIELPSAGDEAAAARADTRERIAAAASLVPVFRPRTVAVIGASRDRRAIGRRLFDALIEAGFEGPVYPVNPSARSVGSVRAYASILEVPDEVDMAVIAVPSDRVLGVVDECARKRVRALVVISAGFAETGPAGKALQDELLQKVRANGMRMVGPNCLGLLNTAPAVSLNASFSPVFPPRGRVAMSSQSGALGLAILDYARQLGIGISSFVAVGNKADVSGNDLLQYWEDDPDTDLVILYLESFGNPRKFARIARRVGRTKPILAVKSGRSRSGSRAARSHTAALASDERAVEALFRQAGVIRADTLEELFEVAQLFESQPLPASNRVAIVTNAGGPGILAADACEARGLALPSLSEVTLARLRAVLPPEAGLSNPIDMIASASAEQYEETLRAVLADPNVDAAIVIFVPVGLTDDVTVAAALCRAHAEPTVAQKTMLACLMSAGLQSATIAAPEVQGQPACVIPSYRFPESAARALSRAVEYAAWRRRPLGQVPALDGADADAVRQVVRQTLSANGPGWLRPNGAAELLAAAGVQLVPFAVAASPDEAANAAEALGFPVAVKVISSEVLHKSDVGGVVLGLDSKDAVRSACAAMQERLGSKLQAFQVQRMAAPGIEVVIGVVEDPSFGPLVGFGLGGTAVEVLNDVTFRITPLTDTDAAEMVRSIRGLPLLQGFRGAPPADLAALETLLLRLSWLVDTAPEIAELEINPAIATPSGVEVVDVRVRLTE